MNSIKVTDMKVSTLQEMVTELFSLIEFRF